MSEMNRTLTWSGIAILVALLAVVTAPRRTVPDDFSDVGERFFPEFNDPNQAASLEVVEYDAETAAARPFKVVNENGVWSIPSHHGYPADGKERLAQTAAGVMQLVKMDFRSSSPSEFEAAGVIDPLDENEASLKGQGKRVTMRSASGEVLADIIIGKELEKHSGNHFVRMPDSKRIYVSKIDFEISTSFADWIEKDLLEVDRADIEKVVLNDYSIDERSGRVDQRDRIELSQIDGTWKADKMSSSQEVDDSKMTALLGALDELSIVGVRRKPAGLSKGLKRLEEEGLRITRADHLDLQSKGYYFSRDGSLLSNEGELQAHTSQGAIYTLRFGEILYGSGDLVSAGGASNADKESGPGENRYLFITTEFSPEAFPEPKAPANTDFEGKDEKEWTAADRENKKLADEHKKWQEKVEQGRAKVEELNRRFADWYYVISDESFKKLDLKRRDLVKRKS